MQPFGTLQASTINIPAGADVSIKVAGQTEGYDGHCFRTFYYWKDRMPDIVDTVESINSIADKYPDLRSKSKAPSFA